MNPAFREAQAQLLTPEAQRICAEGVRVEVPESEEWRRGRPRESRSPDPLLADLHAEALDKMLAEGVLVPVPPQWPEDTLYYLSQIPVLKESGKVREVTDARPINPANLPPGRRPMEDWRSLRDMLQRDDWAVRVDLSQAFFQLGVRDTDRRNLVVLYRGMRAAFAGMPMGMAHSVAMLDKVLQPLVQRWRTLGYRVTYHVDDLLFLFSSKEEALAVVERVLDELTAIGLIVNGTKSMLWPARAWDYLGLHWDSHSMTVTLPRSRRTALATNLRKFYQRVRDAQQVTLRQFASYLGQLEAVRPAHQWMVLQTKPLRILFSTLQRWLGPRAWDNPMVIPVSAPQLSLFAYWGTKSWLADLGVSLVRMDLRPQLVIEEDASPLGWGCVMYRRPGELLGWSQGFWTPGQAAQTSNWREATATLLALRAMGPSIPAGTRLLVYTDNRVNFYNLTNQGTMAPHLNEVVRQVWLEARARGWQVRFDWKAGATMQMADALSRRVMDRSDWMLDPRWFRLACRRWGPLSVDLFATAANAQCPRFVSLLPQPGAWRRDAFSFPWGSLTRLLRGRPWINCPWAVLARALRKARRERAEAVWVIPVQPWKPWWPLVVRMLADEPVVIPPQVGLFRPASRNLRAAGPASHWTWVCLLRPH